MREREGEINGGKREIMHKWAHQMLQKHKFLAKYVHLFSVGLVKKLNMKARRALVKQLPKVVNSN